MLVPSEGGEICDVIWMQTGLRCCTRASCSRNSVDFIAPESQEWLRVLSKGAPVMFQFAGDLTITPPAHRS